MIETNIAKIVTNMRTASDAYFNYQADKKNVLSQYRGSLMEQKLNEAENKARLSIDAAFANIDNELYKIKTETEKGNAYVIDSSSVHDAINLLTVPGIPRVTVEHVLKGFAGNTTALNLIRAHAHKDYDHIIGAYCFDDEGTIDKMSDVLKKLPYQGMEGVPSILSSVKDNLKQFCNSKDIDLEKLGGDTMNAIHERYILDYMGLSPDALNK